MVKETCPHSHSALPRCSLWPFPAPRRLPCVRAVLSFLRDAVYAAGLCLLRPSRAPWAARHACVRPGLRGPVRTPAGSRCPAGRGRAGAARRQRLRVWRKPCPALLPSPCPHRFPSLRQGGLIHELSAGPFDSWAFSRLAAAPGDSEHGLCAGFGSGD